MACGALHSGDRFLAGTLAQLDCQAQAIGAYGFGALSDPGSPTAMALSALLAVFVALFGLRLLVGRAPSGGDQMLDVLRVGVVLTLATSWPAWRVLGYDVLINGPGELFRAIGMASGLPGGAGDLAERMQRADEGLAALNAYGSGRLGVATGDWFQLGFARSAFLTGAILPTALVRLATGLMLALAPLAGALLLFDVSRSLFAGWAKGLAMLFLASLAVSLLHAAELSLIEPWLQDALARRASDQQVLEAPVEGLVITLSFAVAALGLIGFAGRVAFVSGRALAPIATAREWLSDRRAVPPQPILVSGVDEEPVTRARQVAMAVNQSMQREDRRVVQMADRNGGLEGGQTQAGSAALPAAGEQLGSSYRRTSRRHSGSSQRRDRRS